MSAGAYIVYLYKNSVRTFTPPSFLPNVGAAGYRCCQHQSVMPSGVCVWDTRLLGWAGILGLAACNYMRHVHTIGHLWSIFILVEEGSVNIYRLNPSLSLYHSTGIHLNETGASGGECMGRAIDEIFPLQKGSCPMHLSCCSLILIVRLRRA